MKISGEKKYYLARWFIITNVLNNNMTYIQLFLKLDSYFESHKKKITVRVQCILL